MITDADVFARVRSSALVVSGIAWGVLLMQAAAPMHHGSMESPLGTVASAAVTWFLMLVAMMASFVVAPITHVALSSFRRRRWRSVALFIAGYAAIWGMAGGLTVVVLSGNGWSLLPWQVTIAGLLVVAGAWQCSPTKQRCLNRCHAFPAMRAFGAEADRDAVRFGLTHGVWCAGSCWALMLVPVAMPSGHVAAMTAVSALIFAERLERPMPPRWGLHGVPRLRRLATVLIRAGLRAVSRSTAPFRASA